MFQLMPNDPSINRHVQAAYTFTGQMSSRLVDLLEKTVAIQQRGDLTDVQKLQMIYVKLHEATLRIEKTRDVVAGAQAFAILREKLAVGQ